MARVRVIGCGNPDAGDDAVGLEAVSRLGPRVPADVDVVAAGPAVRVLDLLEGADCVIVVDAIRSPVGARAPGSIVRVVADAGDPLPADLRSSLSSHGLGIPETLGLAAAVPELVEAVAADVAEEVLR